MAMALAAKDPATARQLLRQAFDQFTPTEQNRSYFGNSTFPVAAMLLGYSETVDPERTREYFWRTLALHPGPDRGRRRLPVWAHGCRGVCNTPWEAVAGRVVTRITIFRHDVKWREREQ